MKFNKNNLNKPWVGYTVATCSAVTLFVILSNLDFWGSVARKIGVFIYPLFLAAIIAFILNPLVELTSKYIFAKIQSDSLRRNLSVAFTLVTSLLLIAILLIALVPQLVGSLMTLAGNADSYVRSLQRLLGILEQKASELHLDISGMVNSSDSFLDTIRSVLPKSLNSLVSKSINFTKAILEAAIAFILSIYFLVSKDSLRESFKFLLQALLSESAYPQAVEFLKHCHEIFIRYILYDLLDGLIVGGANAVFMAVLGMPYAVLLSVIVGVTNLAPTFGPVIGGAIGCFILVLVNPVYALWFLIFTIVVQAVDGYILKPRLFGDSLGVAPVVLMMAIIVFGRIFGIIGILMSIPSAAIMNYVYHTWLFNVLEKQREVHEREHIEHMRHLKEEADAAAAVEPIQHEAKGPKETTGTGQS